MNSKQLEKQKQELSKNLRILKPKKNIGAVKNETKQLEEEAKLMEVKLQELQTVMTKEKEKTQQLGNLNKRWGNTNSNIPLRNYAQIVMETKTQKDQTIPAEKRILTNREKSQLKQEKKKELQQKIERKMKQLNNPQINTQNIIQNNNQKLSLHQNTLTIQQQKQQIEQKAQLLFKKTPQQNEQKSQKIISTQKSVQKEQIQIEKCEYQVEQKIQDDKSNQQTEIEERRPDETLKQMLYKLNLIQYEQVFLDNGFDELEILIELEKQYLDEMKIPLGHQVKILKEVNLLKQKYNFQQTLKQDKQQQQQQIKDNQEQKQKQKQLLLQQQQEQHQIKLKQEQELKQIQEQEQDLCQKKIENKQEVKKPTTQEIQCQEIILKQTCWYCYKMYYESNAQNQFSKNYCSDECYNNYYEQNHKVCSRNGCDNKFYTLDGVNKNGDWYCHPDCCLTTQQLLNEQKQQEQEQEQEEEYEQEYEDDNESMEKDSLEQDSLEIKKKNDEYPDDEEKKCFQFDMDILEDKYKQINKEVLKGE